MTNSCCAKNQSAAAWLSSSFEAPPIGMPATCSRPSASRRISSCGPSMSSCSKRGSSASSERGDSAAATRGSRKASRPSGSASTTCFNSSAGTQPRDCTSIAPMRTATPSAALALRSTWGRHCSMCGRIAQCRINHATISTHHATASSASVQRTTRRNCNSHGGPASGAAVGVSNMKDGWRRKVRREGPNAGRCADDDSRLPRQCSRDPCASSVVPARR